MLALGAESASLAPTALLAGLALLILPLVPRNSRTVRAALFLIAILLSWRYLICRVTETIPSFDHGLHAILGWWCPLLQPANIHSSP